MTYFGPVYTGDKRPLFTYETSVNEPIHPDPAVASRLVEVAVSDCEYGCKIYADPLSSVKVLGHNSAYGCTK